MLTHCQRLRFHQDLGRNKSDRSGILTKGCCNLQVSPPTRAQLFKAPLAHFPDELLVCSSMLAAVKETFAICHDMDSSEKQADEAQHLPAVVEGFPSGTVSFTNVLAVHNCRCNGKTARET